MDGVGDDTGDVDEAGAVEPVQHGLVQPAPDTGAGPDQEQTADKAPALWSTSTAPAVTRSAGPAMTRAAVISDVFSGGSLFVPAASLLISGEAFREPSYGNCSSSRPMSSIGPRIVQPGPRGRVERKPWAFAYSSASSAVSSGARMIV